MTTTEVLNGVLKPDGTLELEHAPRLPAGQVDVILHSVPSPIRTGEDWWQYLQRMRAEAEEAGGSFRSEADIASERAAFREENQRVEDVCRHPESRSAENPGSIPSISRLQSKAAATGF